jgi:hypothetical protein
MSEEQANPLPRFRMGARVRLTADVPGHNLTAGSVGIVIDSTDVKSVYGSSTTVYSIKFDDRPSEGVAIDHESLEPLPMPTIRPNL